MFLDTVIAFAVVMLLLSLLVTTLVQMALLVTMRRGRNLLWGVERLLNQVDPDLEQHSRDIAEAVLRHPAVSHMGKARALAIRPEELIRLLRDLAGGRNLQSGRPLGDRAKAALQATLQDRATGLSAQQIAQIQAAAAALPELLPTQAAAVKNAISQVVTQTDKLAAEVQAWFDTVMDRTSERFKMHSRWATVGVAALLAFGLQVDSLDIIRQLSNKEIREGVIQLYEPALRLYDDVTGYTKNRASLATDVLKGMAIDPVFQPFLGGATPPPELELRSEGRDWLQGQLAGKPELSQAQKAFEERYETAAKTLSDKFNEEAGKTKDLLDKTGLLVIPAKRLPVGDWNLRKLAGLLATAFFLSLGAPFWYNTLRKLADLRPVVARKVEGEPAKALQ
jgi:hypothetical protein